MYKARWWQKKSNVNVTERMNLTEIQLRNLDRGSWIIPALWTESYLHVWSSGSDGLQCVGANSIDHVLELARLNVSEFTSLANLQFILFSLVNNLRFTRVPQSIKLRLLQQCDPILSPPTTMHMWPHSVTQLSQLAVQWIVLSAVDLSHYWISLHTSQVMLRATILCNINVKLRQVLWLMISF